MASLTKIMTSVVVLDLLSEFAASHFARLDASVTILPCATELVGTSAQLYPGDTLSVNHLLYGMMLPSGNDAA